MKRVIAFILFASIAGTSGIAFARPPSTLLIVPDRLAMIRFAFDMQSLRQADVVCWREAQDGEPLRLFYWTKGKWNPLSTNQFRTLSFLPRPPDKILFLGLRSPALEKLLDRPNIAVVESFDTSVLANHLDPFYSFSPEEWRLLSRRYGFMIYDLNAPRRQQSRYGDTPPPDWPAGSRKPPVIFQTPPPPAQIQEAPVPASPATPAPTE